jgi:hypothetical protein
MSINTYRSKQGHVLMAGKLLCCLFAPHGFTWDTGECITVSRRLAANLLRQIRNGSTDLKVPVCYDGEAGQFDLLDPDAETARLERGGS